MRDLPPETLRQGGVFTTEQALRSGWKRPALTRACDARRLVRVRFGVYALPTLIPPDAAGNPGSRFMLEELQLQRQSIAAALRIPSAVISHQAAAVLLGLPILGSASRPCLTLPPGFRTSGVGVHIHRMRLAPGQIQYVFDVPVTTPARTSLDLARERGLETGLVTADAALRTAALSRDELKAVYATMRGRGGSPAARELLDRVDARHESPLETLSALAMRDIELTATPQVELFRPDGTFLARVDFYFEELGVVGEADGRSKYSDDELWREKRRQEALADHGLIVCRWGYTDAVQPARLRARLQRAFDRARTLRAAGVAVTARTRFARERFGSAA